MAALGAENERLEGRLRDVVFYTGLTEFEMDMLKMRDEKYRVKDDHYKAWERLIKAHRPDMTADSLVAMNSTEVPTEQLGLIRRMIRYEQARKINLAGVPDLIERYQKKNQEMVG